MGKAQPYATQERIVLTVNGHRLGNKATEKKPFDYHEKIWSLPSVKFIRNR